MKNNSSILVRYLTNNLSAAERIIIDRWYTDMQHNGPEDECDFELLERRLWSRIVTNIQQTSSPNKSTTTLK